MGTSELQQWILANIVPLLILTAAVVIMLIGFSGNNAKVMKVVTCVLVGLAVLGLAVGGNAQTVGSSLWGLFK